MKQTDMKRKPTKQGAAGDLMEALGSLLDGAGSAPPVVPPTSRNSPVLRSKLKADQTPDAAVAEMAVDGLAMNAVTTMKFSSTLMPSDADLTEIFVSVTENAEAIKRGDHSSAEAILGGQIVSLNAIYTQLASMAADNFKQLDTFERLMRLAFKAQSQCRSSAESLAFIRNPGGAVFARQANITNGPQQVNNHVGSADHARTERAESRPNELKQIEAKHEPLDTRAARTTSAADSRMATVGTRNGTAKPKR